MTDVLKSRGPDDKGIWIDKKNNISFGHRRLSIIELSKLGSQPMLSQNKRYVITFNGEIYNFPNLKKELKSENVSFYSNSDTEVLLYSYMDKGIDCLKQFNGMFSFILYDHKKKKLFCSRYFVGVVP